MEHAFGIRAAPSQLFHHLYDNSGISLLIIEAQFAANAAHVEYARSQRKKGWHLLPTLTDSGSPIAHG
ncbi:MAG: hypothetical protein Q7T25_15255 [Sideroxyarcus sp.]|nr:hypothetical protein [Sideroxyarcus sp.]